MKRGSDVIIKDFSDINIIGLTGMSGAGKTTVCAAFAENGYSVLNCDEIVKQTMTANSPCINEIKKYFSENIINADGELDRKKTAFIIFNNPDKKLDYEKIIFPFISYSLIKKIKSLSDKGEDKILLDAPTLFESGTDSLCGKIVSIVSQKEAVTERIMKRDNISRKEASLRIKSQKSSEYYIERSDYFIENDGEKDELMNKTQKIINELRRANDCKKKEIKCV